ncbi:hypothetical protein GON03_18385 [Nocardioides sp. MAH-18]|uniref:Bacterial Ig-like domain-containing protein n=1 Tax=Nocardioides agri TaxID=2682843 RepID=A0A6L6XUU4_9ACTN|nr:MULTISPECIES: Ig-like domain-containing protein [unclassified Nocardioides]MBA2956311.1 Ig-like domain repeat protein [Nocardioides sp. CGMCC 1.13656]MVQ51154.1 hypothetical protein [Nocardioides sp. MAH-18]
MNLRRLSARTAAAGATAALAAGALVGLGTATADAATATATYNCVQAEFSLSYNFAITITQTPATTPTWAGQAVAKGKLGTISVSASVPADAAATMASVGITGARSDDFKLGGNVPFAVAGDFAPGAGGTATWQGTGTNPAFAAAKPGAFSATIPSKFTIITAKTGDGFKLDCSLVAGQVQASMWDTTLAKQTTKTTAKNTTGKSGKPVKLKVTVKGNGSVATAGQVVVSSGKKAVGKANVNPKTGVATVTLKKLEDGKNKLTLTYKGTPSFGASKGKVTVTVK